MTDNTPDIVEALQNAGPDQLEAIRLRIGEVNRELAGLRQAERILSSRIEGSKAGQVKGEPSANARRIIDLLETSGTQSLGWIATRMHMDENQIRMIVRRAHRWLKIDRHNAVSLVKQSQG